MFEAEPAALAGILHAQPMQVLCLAPANSEQSLLGTGIHKRRLLGSGAVPTQAFHPPNAGGWQRLAGRGSASWGCEECAVALKDGAGRTVAVALIVISLTAVNKALKAVVLGNQGPVANTAKSIKASAATPEVVDEVEEKKWAPAGSPTEVPAPRAEPRQGTAMPYEPTIAPPPPLAVDIPDPSSSHHQGAAGSGTGDAGAQGQRSGHHHPHNGTPWSQSGAPTVGSGTLSLGEGPLFSVGKVTRASGVGLDSARGGYSTLARAGSPGGFPTEGGGGELACDGAATPVDSVTPGFTYSSDGSPAFFTVHEAEDGVVRATPRSKNMNESLASTADGSWKSEGAPSSQSPSSVLPHQPQEASRWLPVGSGSEPGVRHSLAGADTAIFVNARQSGSGATGTGAVSSVSTGLVGLNHAPSAAANAPTTAAPVPTATAAAATTVTTPSTMTAAAVPLQPAISTQGADAAVAAVSDTAAVPSFWREEAYSFQPRPLFYAPGWVPPPPSAPSRGSTSNNNGSAPPTNGPLAGARSDGTIRSPSGALDVNTLEKALARIEERLSALPPASDGCSSGNLGGAATTTVGAAGTGGASLVNASAAGGGGLLRQVLGEMAHLRTKNNNTADVPTATSTSGQPFDASTPGNTGGSSSGINDGRASVLGQLFVELAHLQQTVTAEKQHQLRASRASNAVPMMSTARDEATRAKDGTKDSTMKSENDARRTSFESNEGGTASVLRVRRRPGNSPAWKKRYSKQDNARSSEKPSTAHNTGAQLPPPPPPLHSPGAGERLEEWFAEHADDAGTVAGSALAEELASEEYGSYGTRRDSKHQPSVLLEWVRSGKGEEQGGRSHNNATEGEVRVSHARAMGLLSRVAAGQDGQGELAFKSEFVPSPGIGN